MSPGKTDDRLRFVDVAVRGGTGRVLGDATAEVEARGAVVALSGVDLHAGLR